MPFIVDKNMRPSCVETLRRLDDRIYFSHFCENVYSPVNTHPDIQIHFVNDKTAFVPPELYDYYRNILPRNVVLHKGNKRLGGTYPSDIAYNISRIGNNVILNLKYADENIIKYYRENGFNLVNVNQGYSKCNICSDGKAAVTEDEGIYKVLLRSNIPALKIRHGSVLLSGFDYGFIGGASGYFENRILFCGKVEDAPNYNEIKSFFSQNNTELLSLDSESLTDYGSIIFFE